MSEPGFDEFAGLWQHADQGEQEAFDVLARRARRQGRLLAYGDMMLGFLIVALTMVGVFLTPNRVTLIGAVVLIVLTTWVTVQRRRYRQMSASLVAGDRKTFLDNSIGHATGNVRRVTLSLVSLPFLFGLAVLFRLSVVHKGYPSPEVIAAWARSWHGVFALTGFSVAAALTERSRRRFRSELRRLLAVKSEYEQEGRREALEE